MTPFVLFAALGVRGLRSPWAWTPFSVLSWALALGAAPRRRMPGAVLWAAALGLSLASALACAEPVLSLAAFAWAATAWLWLLLGATRADSGERLWGERLLWGAALTTCAAAALVTVPSFPAVGLFFPYYNYTAALAAAAGAAACAAWAYRRGGTGLLGAAGAAVYLLWAGSRGGLAGLGAGCAVSLWRAGRRGFVAAGAVAVAIFLLAPTPARERLLKAARPGSHARPAIWAAALETAADHPWLGEGPGEFARGFLRHQVPTPPALGLPRYALSTDHAHSEPLEALATLGTPGLVLVLAALAALWRRRPQPGTEPARETLLAAAVALATQALGDSIFALPALGWVFAWCLGAACAPDDAGAPRVPEAPRRLALGAGLALASVAWWPSWAVSAWRGGAPGRALALAPADAGLWEDAARDALRSGDEAGALAALDRASRLAPYDAVPRVMAAEVLRRREAWPAVRALAGDALELEPACGQAFLLRAEADLRLGRPEEARRDLAALSSSGARPLTETPGEEHTRLLSGYDAGRLAELRAELPIPGR